MAVNVRAVCVADPHLDALGKSRIGVPALRPTHLQGSGCPIARDALHAQSVVHMFYPGQSRASAGDECVSVTQRRG